LKNDKVESKLIGKQLNLYWQLNGELWLLSILNVPLDLRTSLISWFKLRLISLPSLVSKVNFLFNWSFLHVD
jgi:hypothetical protein